MRTYVFYAHWIFDRIKNCGCIVKIHGFKVAEIYAIMDINKSLVLVVSKGILASHFQAELMSKLVAYVWEFGDPYSNVYWDYTSSPILNPPR